MICVDGTSIPHGWVWIYYQGSWSMCYKKQYGIRDEECECNLDKDDLRDALFTPIKKPSTP